MRLREDAVLFLATGCRVGNIPFAPGTLGTLVGLPLCFILTGIALMPAILCTLLFILFSVWIADAAEKILDQKDPGCIVIDEIAGILVTLVGLPFNTATVLGGFFLFRILDISKPFPIRKIDKRVAGGLGVVADDVAAGIIAHIILEGMIYFYGFIVN